MAAPIVELIFSIAEEGVGLHTICNRLRKAKVIKPSFYKKEMFERYIDEEKMYDWDTVQKILESRPPVIRESSSGYDNIFRGIIKCADCGSAMLAKVEQKRKRNNVIDKTFYYCTKYRKFGKDGCSSHTIEARTVHEVVLADIQKHAGQALMDRKAMVTEIAERLNLQLSADREQFAEQISGYAGITELNFKIINQLIEKFLFLNP